MPTVDFFDEKTAAVTGCGAPGDQSLSPRLDPLKSVLARSRVSAEGSY